MMRPRLVIFDCDGVLVDSEPLALKALLESVAEAGVALTTEAASARFLGLSLASTTAILAEEFGARLGEDDLARMRRRLYGLFERDLTATRNVAEALDRIELPRCVASSSQPERIELTLRISGLFDRLHPHIFSSTMVVRGKPAPDLFLHAARTMGVDPTRCLVIEDSPAGVQAARRARMQVFGYVGGSHISGTGHAEALRAAGASLVFDDMAELPGLVDSLSESRRRSAEGDLVIGVDVGTASARAGVFNASGELLDYAKRPISLHRPRPEIAEQDSEEIWGAVCGAVREAINAAGVDPAQVRGIGFDATTSLVARDADEAPVSVSGAGVSRWDVIAWMDHRAETEARDATAANNSDLSRDGAVVSVEMQTPKVLWLKRQLPDSWRRAAHLFDLADFLTWRATGSVARSACTLGSKWPISTDDDHGWRRRYLRSLDLEDMIEKCGGEQARVTIGKAIDTLSPDAAEALSLSADCRVAAGMIDAHAGMLGASPKDAFESGSASALIAGTSTCIMTVSPAPIVIEGVWGPYFSVVAPGLWMNELGQSASGALLDHMIEWHGAGGAPSSGEHIRIIDRILELRAEEGLDLAPGLHVVPEFHGDRSNPDRPLGLGMICGLTLGAGFDDLCRLYWRTAVGLALDLADVKDRLQSGGAPVREISVAGGHSENDLLIQLYASALDMPIRVSESEFPVLLGAAMTAAAAAGVYVDFSAAREAMAQPGRIVQPDPDLRAMLTRDRRIAKTLIEARTKALA